ncbi:peptide-methionine (S)-S-oxide reductase MsrA [Pseudidiomarina taiwanensis]|uniref:Peptide methionine sulfoxide reductase MsrA n=1 Tax=Pseudidiomarina taiwanensis TaxID=337250 RepID=A0A432ZKF2_9GAMM|nr:peptide-methionine (S)-S-oxide reductase MsrA [Pseudidiomarina taiwanensis]RUO78448.1 peptide-methionine (S)-S-oxide reductase [Pseudidiomarina taiwanensis]
MQQITLGGGCFWCIEAAFRQVRGIVSAQSGYSGGTVPQPSYEQVCSGQTGHVEVVQLNFDPEVISVREIYEIFFTLHDPTQLNRQGNDIGPQYRGVIFYHNDEQRELAEQIIAEMTHEQTWDQPIVTAIEPAQTFWPAEDAHENYVARNPQNPYCQAVIHPKLAKFKKTFADKLN